MVCLIYVTTSGHTFTELCIQCMLNYKQFFCTNPLFVFDFNQTTLPENIRECNFSKICARVLRRCMTNGSIDTHEIQIQLFFLYKQQKNLTTATSSR